MAMTAEPDVSQSTSYPVPSSFDPIDRGYGEVASVNCVPYERLPFRHLRASGRHANRLPLR